jgi:hypothetical protein
MKEVLTSTNATDTAFVTMELPLANLDAKLTIYEHRRQQQV